MTALYYILLLLFLLICLLLMLIILIQKGRGGGLAGAFGGGGGGNTAFGSKTGDVLTWATSVIFGVFLLLAVGLNWVSNSRASQALAPAIVSPAATPAPGETGIDPMQPQVPGGTSDPGVAEPRVTVPSPNAVGATEGVPPAPAETGTAADPAVQATPAPEAVTPEPQQP